MQDWTLWVAQRHHLGVLVEDRHSTPTDHLTLPTIPPFRPPQILYVGRDNSYDSLLPFSTYPERRGWTAQEIIDPKRTGRPSLGIEEFFQDWLIFGLLAEVPRIPIDRSDFIAINEHDEFVLTTRALPRLYQHWYSRDRRLSKIAQERHAKRASQALGLVCNVLCDWTAHGSSPLTPWTTMYLIILAQNLDVILSTVYEEAMGIVSDETALSLIESNKTIPTTP